MFCKTCGYQLKETQKFCPRCGAKVHEEVVSDSVARESSVASMGSPSQQDLVSPLGGSESSVQEEADHPSNDSSSQEASTSENLTPVASVVADESSSNSLTLESNNKETSKTVMNESDPIPKENGESSQPKESPDTSLEVSPILENQSESVKTSAEDNINVDSVNETGTPNESEISNPSNEPPTIETPLPDGILLIIRTKLMEHGELNQQSIDDLYLQTRAAGISDDRTEYQLQKEVNLYGAKTDANVEDEPDQVEQERDETKANSLKWLWITIPIFLLLLLGTFGFVFRVELLAALDSVGFRTTALRDVTNVSNERNIKDDLATGDNDDKNDDNSISYDRESTPTLDPDPETEPESKTESPSLDSEPSLDSRQPERQTELPQPSDSKRVVPSIQEIQKPTSTTYTFVDQMPRYPGETDGLMRFIQRNVNYPLKARSQGISGTVYVRYVVSENGTVVDVEVKRGVHPLLDAAAVEVIESVNGYSPGYQDGKPVRVEFTIPIRFIL